MAPTCKFTYSELFTGLMVPLTNLNLLTLYVEQLRLRFASKMLRQILNAFRSEFVSKHEAMYKHIYAKRATSCSTPTTFEIETLYIMAQISEVLLVRWLLSVLTLVNKGTKNTKITPSKREIHFSNCVDSSLSLYFASPLFQALIIGIFLCLLSHWWIKVNLTALVLFIWEPFSTFVSLNENVILRQL